ncbi:MAG: hypothetical protein NUV57_03840 [archaeon]|nr:hypothetical protein [archaeon]
MSEMYTGPVLFLVHPEALFMTPDKSVPLEVKQVMAARKKLASAIEAAALRKIPVIVERVEVMKGKLSPPYAERNFQDFINCLKHVPKIHRTNIVIGDYGGRENFISTKEQFKSLGLIPSKFVVMGIYRELCCDKALRTLQHGFPTANFHLIEGSSTVSVKPRDELTRKTMDYSWLGRSKKLIPARHFA